MLIKDLTKGVATINTSLPTRTFQAKMASYPFKNSEARSYVARMIVAPLEQECSLIDNLLTAIKVVGIAKFDGFYLSCLANNQPDALLNILSANYPLVNTAATFTPGRGFLGNGTSSVLDIAYNPSTTGGATTLNSAHLSVVTLKATDNGLQIIGVPGVTNLSFLLLDGTSAVIRLNTDTTLALGSGQSNKQGHWVANRSTSVNQQAYRNGSSIGTDTATPSTALPNATTKLLNFTTNFSDQEIAMAHFGGSLTSGEVSSLYTNGILPILTYKSLP